MAPLYAETFAAPASGSFDPSAVAAIAAAGLPAKVTLAPAQLVQLLPILRQVISAPIVVEVSTLASERDHSQVLALRSSGFNILYSSAQEEAERNNIVAASFVARNSSAVLHYGEFTSTAIEGDVVADVDSFDTAFNAVKATPFTHYGTPLPKTLLIVLGQTFPLLTSLPAQTAILSFTLYRPLSPSALRSLVPSSVETVVVLEQSYTKTAKWNPVFLDVVGAFAEADDDVKVPLILSGVLGAVKDGVSAFAEISAAVASSTHRFTVGALPSPPAAVATSSKIPAHESTYTNLLTEVFGSRLWLANAPSSLLPKATTISATSPEYALGHVLGAEEKTRNLQKSVRGLLDAGISDEKASKALTAWLQTGDEKSSKAAQAVAGSVGLSSDAFVKKSNWIVGSEAWSHDLGASGLHHALSTGANVNLLLIDTTPYTLPSASTDKPTRKDAGLYAMNYGGAYVASVAVYGDFSQTLRAFAEADAYNGPSVILAYLPGGEDDRTRALEVLKSTKRAIEIGSWPLYRWNPSPNHKEPFALDSEKIKADLRDFLDRQNHLTELSSRLPTFGEALESGLSAPLVKAQKAKAKAAFEALAGALEGPPLLVLYASDGGNAEKLAKKFVTRARARGVAARILAFDDLPLEDLHLETNVAFITSVAGQGEFPQNGREFWKGLQTGKITSVGDVKIAVFGMGDSHYWPRKEDAHYYNKSAKDLWKKLTDLGGTPLVELGLGDDQDPDGPQTAYKVWEPAMWKALGVDGFEDNEPELEPITNEHIKIASNYLRGTIVEGLNDKSTGALAESDGQLTKFHGIYQQDDRDIRDERKAAGLEPAFSFMVRMRLPAGVCTPEQWLAVDEISDKRGNNTFKLTTRQTFQFHGIIKSNLKPAIQEINKMMLDTVAACGDVNRTVMCSANPSLGALHTKVFAFATELSENLKPQTSAYAEIWLDKKMVAGEAVKDVEPLYGEYYLPRKFKIAIAVPPTNDVDVYCHDLGYIAILDEQKELLGFNVTIGGGMGVTHSMKSTYPRLADVIGFITPEQGLDVAKAVLTTQRDNGNRANRKNARVKYTIDRMGLENFVAEVEKRLGWKLPAAKPFTFTSNTDQFGWQTGHDGKRHFTAFVENGRVQDEPGKPFKVALREIAKVHKGVFRLTANQHLIISDIPPEEEKTIQALLTKYHLDNVDFTGLRLSAMACVSLPTCGLGMAESERYLPVLIDKVEALLEESGLRNDSITMRMTGCPNGCARPWAAEVAFVGKAPGSYVMLLGGGYYGQRLNKIYREAVGEEEILQILAPMIKAYALERTEGERFGDFVIRKGIISPTLSGKQFYEGSSPGVTEVEA